MITALGGRALTELLKKVATPLIERITPLIERIGIFFEENAPLAISKVFRELSEEGFQELLQYLVENHFIEFIFITLGVFFIGWALKILAKDKQSLVIISNW